MMPFPLSDPSRGQCNEQHARGRCKNLRGHVGSCETEPPVGSKHGFFWWPESKPDKPQYSHGWPIGSDGEKVYTSNAFERRSWDPTRPDPLAIWRR